jgi:hypothetical protein
LWATSFSKAIPDGFSFIVVRKIKSFAEEGPLFSHLINLLINLSVFLFLFISLFLLSKSGKFLLGILSLLLELSENFCAVLLFELLFLLGISEAIRSMSKSLLAIKAIDVESFVLGVELSALLLEL